MNVLPRRRRRALAFIAALLAAPAFAQQPEKPVLLVFAAASLTDVLQELSSDFERSSRLTIKLSFASSAALARQIEAGSNAHVYIAADQEWMDYLARRDLIEKASRRDLAGNRLVLIAPADSRVQLAIRPGFGIGQALGEGRLSMADPDIVPAGRYARAALTSLGVWDQVSAKLVRAENVRAALIYVARGESPLGVVYATDARVDARVRVIGTFPDRSHEPITYSAATLVAAGPQATAYLDFLAGSAAVWKKHGFVSPGK